jgi:hypothetical protein
LASSCNASTSTWQPGGSETDEDPVLQRPACLRAQL